MELYHNIKHVYSCNIYLFYTSDVYHVMYFYMTRADTVKYDGFNLIMDSETLFIYILN